MAKRYLLVLLPLLAVACGASGRGGGPLGADFAGTLADLSGGLAGDSGGLLPPGCGSTAAGCYTVYAHANHTLYKIDLSTKTLVTIGAFKAPKVGSSEDVITDLAVAPDNTIYVISKTQLYRADAGDGHVTAVGAVTACGSDNVALTTTPDGNLYAGDFLGALCKINLATSPPTVTQLGTLGGGMALSGDLVAVSDGTMFGTAYKISDAATKKNNILVKIDPATGAASQVLGATGYPELYGIAYAMGLVFGFTHDGSGDVVTIDPMTGKGTLFNSFTDPATTKGIAFAGAGVNSMVAVTIM